MNSPRPVSIALFGTFDVENYGDLLFPHLVKQRLCRPGDTLHAFSPLGGAVSWRDAMASTPIAEAAAAALDLCIVGGGNIISGEPTSLPAYASLGQRLAFAYPSLWLGAAAVAAVKNIPLVWNAPGLPSEIRRPWVRQLAALALGACDYVATRDEQSKTWLRSPRPVSVVPDVALGVSELWPASTLRDRARDSFLSRGIEPPERWIVFHFNSRYMDGDAREAAGLAARMAASLDAMPVLLAIGPCHGDDVLAREISSHLARGLVVDRPGELKEVAALIAHSAGYVGSSLHGLITALSYHRPAVAVAGTLMPKFRGFLEQVAMPYRLVETWSDAELAVPIRLQELSADELASIDRATSTIDEHWVQLREYIDKQDPEAQRGRRRLFEAIHEDQPPRWQWRAVDSMIRGADLPCPICGGTAFVPGPGGRLSRTGKPPQCVECRSLERHRVFRLIFDGIRTPAYRQLSSLMFSQDRSIAGGWFGNHETSVFGQKNTLDLQQIDRPDASYDVVVCNHVLEHVADYRSALRELARITRPDGLLFLSFPEPRSRRRTVDWGYPRADQHGHYRLFGRDVEAVFAVELPDQRIVAVTGNDPVTGSADMAYILTRSQVLDDALAAGGLSFRLVQAGRPIPAPSAAPSSRDEVTVLAEALRGPTSLDLGPRLSDLVARRRREARPRLLLGEWLCRTGRLAEAAACFREAMKDFPDSPWPVLRMFRLHLERNELREACGLYVRTLRDGPLPDHVKSELRHEIAVRIAETGVQRDLLAMVEIEGIADCSPESPRPDTPSAED